MMTVYLAPIRCLECDQEIKAGEDFVAQCPALPSGQGHRLNSMQLMALVYRVEEAEDG